MRGALGNLPGERFAGRVLRVGRALDSDTRKYPVPVRIPNAERRLLPSQTQVFHSWFGPIA